MWRAVSTATGPAKHVRELKRHVLRLYKHIHPDRLGRYPKQRAINESSFQVLQSAVDRHFDRVNARTNDIPPQAPQAPQNLTFFATHTDGLRKAVVKFHESRLGHALHSLFEELGLDPPPAEVLPGGRVSGVQFGSLTELVRHARQVAMRSVKSQEKAAQEAQALDDEVVVTRLALQRSRGVRITLGDGLPGDERLVLIFRRLARTLREMRDINHASLVIELDGGFDVSLNTDAVFPWVCLGACASDESWRDLLRSEGVRVACESSRSFMAGIQHLEVLVARDLGVRLVMHDISLLDAAGGEVSPGGVLEGLLAGTAVLQEHKAFLEGVHSRALRGEGVRTAGVSSLALMLSAHAGTQLDAEQGVVRVGLAAGVEAGLETLRREGARVCREHDAREAERARLAGVRRALGVASIRRGAGLGDREWELALAHMRGDAARLRGVLDGTPVVVGTQAKVLQGGEIEIPFDFRAAMGL